MRGATSAGSTRSTVSASAHRRGFWWRHTIGQRPISPKMPPTRNPKWRNCRTSFVRDMQVSFASVQLELFAPVAVTLERLLVGLLEDAVFQDQDVHLRAHEAAIGIGGRADDGLTTHVEGRVH